MNAPGPPGTCISSPGCALYRDGRISVGRGLLFLLPRLPRLRPGSQKDRRRTPLADTRVYPAGDGSLGYFDVHISGDFRRTERWLSRALSHGTACRVRSWLSP